MPELKVYTATELKKTALMMELVRLTFETVVPGRPIKLKKWYGPGAVANALLEQHWENPGTLAPSSATSKRRSRLWTRRGEDRSCGPSGRSSADAAS